MKYAVEGLTLARELGIRDVIAVLQANLSNIQEDQGEYGSALASLEEASAIAEEMGDQRLLATCLSYEGSVRTRLGDREGAARALDESLRLMTKMDKPEGIAEVQIFRGALLQAEGREEEARVALDTALTEARRARHHRLQLLARLGGASARGATAELEKLRDEARAAGLTPLIAPASLALARLYQAAGRPVEALDAAEEALAAAGPLRQRDMSLQAGLVAGQVLEAGGSSSAAADRYVAAVVALEEMTANLQGEALAAFQARPETAAFSEAVAALRAAGRGAEADRAEAALRR